MFSVLSDKFLEFWRAPGGLWRGAARREWPAPLPRGATKPRAAWGTQEFKKFVRQDARIGQSQRGLSILLLALSVGACGGDSQGSTAEGASGVTLGEVRTRVGTARAQSARLSLDRDYTGVVTPFRKAMVAAEVGGRVVERLVEPGDLVSEGDALIVLDDARARIAKDRAEASLEARRVELVDATRNLERGQQLAQSGAISDRELDALSLVSDRARAALQVGEAALRDAAKNLEDTRVLAPFDGRVEVVSVQVGDFLAPGRNVASVIDFSKARVRVGVTAGEAASLSPGTPVRIGFEAIRRGSVEGQIKSVGHSAADQGMFPVEVWIEGEAASGLREGMVASVALSSARKSPQIVVPASAVFRRDGATHVFRVEADSRARLVAVTTGLASGGRVEITSGLSVGDEVITHGQFALGDGAPVEVTGSGGR